MMRFSPLPFLSPLLACTTGTAFLLLASACTTAGTSRDQAVAQRPLMPTVVPPPKAAVVAVSESEALAASLAAARTGDFSSAQRALQSLPDRSARARATSAVVATLSAENPVNASAFALTLPPDSTQFDALKIAAHARAAKDPVEAVTWALTLTDPATANAARRTIVEDLVRTDPGSALNRLRALPPTPARDDTLSLAVAAWAHRDTDAALAWTRAVDDEALRQRLTFSAVYAIAQRTPARAAQIAETLPAGRQRGQVFSAIAETWIATDSNAAMAWVGKLPPGELRQAAMAGVETGSGAAGLRRRNSGPRLGGASRVGGTGAVPVAPTSPTLDPNLPEFSSWLAAQILPMTRDEAIVEFIKQRGALDVGAIGNWITTLPGGPTRQRALETYFDQAIRTSPSAAANWLRSVPASDRSDAMVEEVARRLLQTEPNAAADFLRNSNLPQFRQDEILRSTPH